jgi:hypothetical protein
MSQNRGQRDLTSQVGTIGAMRARDVSRPNEDDLATADTEVVVSYRPSRPSRPAANSAQESSARGGSSPDVS